MSQIYLEKCNICFIPFIALKRNILENSDFVLLKEDIHRFISSIELFLRDIRGLRYADLKKVNFFAGHPVAYKLCGGVARDYMVRCQRLYGG